MFKDSRKSLSIFLLLGMCFGLLGAHNHYLGYYWRGILQFLLLLFGLLFIPYLSFLIYGLLFCVIIEMFVIDEDAKGNNLKLYF